MPRSATFLLLLVPLLQPAAGPAWAQTITLLPRAEVDRVEVALGQIARINSPVDGEAAQLSGLAVQQAPAVGGTVNITLAQLRDRLTELGVNRAVWTLQGASNCRISRIESATEQISRLKEQSAELRAGLSGPVVNVPEEAIPDSLAGCICKLLEDQYQPAGGKLVTRFEPADRALLALARPTYRFELAVRRTSEQYVEVAVQVYDGSAGTTKSSDVANSPDAALPVRENVSSQSNAGDRVTPIKSSVVRVRTELSAPVVVAAKVINRGQVVAPEDVRITPRPIGLTSPACRDAALVIGQQAKRVVRIDEIIQPGDLTPMALVRRNKLVTVWSRRGGMLIKTVGRAMADGAYGERVLVRNENSREPFYAIVTGPDTVELDPTPALETGHGDGRDVAARQ